MWSDLHRTSSGRLGAHIPCAVRKADERLQQHLNQSWHFVHGTLFVQADERLQQRRQQAAAEHSRKLQELLEVQARSVQELEQCHEQESAALQLGVATSMGAAEQALQDEHRAALAGGSTVRQWMPARCGMCI